MYDRKEQLLPIQTFIPKGKFILKVYLGGKKIILYRFESSPDNMNY